MPGLYTEYPSCLKYGGSHRIAPTRRIKHFPLGHTPSAIIGFDSREEAQGVIEALNGVQLEGCQAPMVRRCRLTL